MGDQRTARQQREARALDDPVNRCDVAEVRSLLDAGVDPNVRDVTGNPMLRNAAWVAAVDVAKLLSERGADVNGRDADGMTALGVAVSIGHNEYGHNEVILLLRGHGGTV
jgi:ankyrin repeat protein